MTRCLWLGLGAVVMLANAGTFGAATFPLAVVLVVAWLLDRGDHDSGANPPPLRTRKKVGP